MATGTRPRITARPRASTRRKSEVRALRREGQIPASIFGHGEPVNIQVSAKAFDDYLRHHTPSAILDLEVDGSTSPALIREMDRDPVSGVIICLGFQRVGLRETVKTTVPLIFHGEAELIANDLVFERQMDELEVHVRVDQLPEAITVDVSSMEDGETLRIADLDLPAGVEPTKEPDAVVARAALPSVPVEVAAALDAEEAAQEERAALAAEEAQEEEAEAEAPAATE